MTSLLFLWSLGSLIIRRSILDGICFVESFVLFPFLKVLLYDGHFADAVDFILLKVSKMQIYQLQYLLFHFLFVLSTDKFAVIYEFFPFQNQHQELEQLFSDFNANIGGHDCKVNSTLVFNDAVSDDIELGEPIKNIFGILNKVIFKVFFLHLIIGLGNIVRKFSRKSLIFAFQSVLLHFLKPLLRLIVFFL